MNDSILQAREERAKLVDSMINSNPIILIKANIPGFDKSIPASFFLVNYFINLITDKFKVIKKDFLTSLDGPYWIVEIKYKGQQSKLKEMLINIEDHHPLGRLIDLDLFYKNKNSISRNELNRPLRKCLLCDNDAIICGKNRTHTYKELLSKIDDLILSFLKDEIRIIIDQAITFEAQLEPKFGLVGLTSKGSHPDMDYNLLEVSKQVIIEPLVEMFASGYIYELDEAFIICREIGKLAEDAMFKVTNNINTYKGLIFVLGIVLISVGRCFKEYNFNLYDNIKYLGRNLLKEFSENTDNENQTFGIHAYHKYLITGIRGEVYNGLPSVRNMELIDFSKESLLMTLIKLISTVDDTVLLKRAGSIEKYHHYRHLIGNIKKYDIDLINKITEECIEENISFGGSADLLIVVIFIKKVEEIFNIKYE